MAVRRRGAMRWGLLMMPEPARSGSPIDGSFAGKAARDPIMTRLHVDT